MISFTEILPENLEIIEEIAVLENEIFQDPWSRKEVLSTVEQKHSFCVAAQENNRVVGYFLCYYVLDECEIARIATKKEMRRQGIGQQLFEEMLSGCKDRGLEKILLDVRAGNKPAISFYQKNGFTVDGLRKAYYAGENPEDAVLMSRDV